MRSVRCCGHGRDREYAVILLVGSFEQFDPEEADRVGADAFVTKPFQSIRQLVEQVKELLDRAEQPEETPIQEDVTRLYRLHRNTTPQILKTYTSKVSPKRWRCRQKWPRK
jgi:DNA-binding response OmpR family regulator